VIGTRPYGGIDLSWKIFRLRISGGIPFCRVLVFTDSGYNYKMQIPSLKRYLSGILLLAAIVLFTGCNPRQTPTISPQPTDLPTSPTVIVSTAIMEMTPTAVEIPAAIVVNSEIVPLSYYQNEVQRYRDSLIGEAVQPSDAEIQQVVLDFLVDQQLLVQAAHQAGFSISDEALQQRIDDLLTELGSGSALTNWMELNHFDDTEFRLSLRLAAEAAWQRDQVIQSVPNEVEQVRAQQIFASTQAGAERALNSLNAGADFNKLAWEFSPESGGELGWFPRGYLLYPEVEEAVFTLQPGTYSEIIRSTLGYHILLVLEYDQAHALTTDARVALQSVALENWLTVARANAQIENRLP